MSDVRFSTIGSELYKGTAAFGKIFSIISLVAGIIVGIVLIVVGSLMIRNSHIYEKTSVQGTVLGSGLNEVSVQYKVGDTECKASTANFSGTTYTVGQTVDVYYKSKDPCKDPLVGERPSAAVGYGIIVGAILLMIISGVYTWFVFKSRGVAAITGVEGLLGRL